MIEELIENQQQLLNGDLPIKAGQNENFPEAMSLGDEIRQGDLYIRLVEVIPDGYKKVDPFLQMVPGKTKGAKHCWVNMPNECYVPTGWSTDESYDGLLGPIVKNYQPNSLAHKEHGHVTNFNTQCYVQFGYQKSQDVEEERIRRQQD